MSVKDLGITRITDQIFQVDVSLPEWPRTVAAYVLKGSKVAIVDCGYASTYNSILRGLNELRIDLSDVSYLIPTHLHLDHGGGTGHLLRHTPNAQVIAHERGVPHFVDPRILIQSATSVYGEKIMRMYGNPIPIDKDKIVPVERELRIDLGREFSVTALQTPGHAPHQISVFIDKQKRLLTADAVGMTLFNFQRIIPSTPPPSFDNTKFVDTIGALLKLNPRELLVPHYGVWTNARDILEQTRAETEKWIDNVDRFERMGLTVDEIVERLMYGLAEDAEVERAGLDKFIQRSVRVSVMGILKFLGKIPQPSNVRV